MRCSLVCVAVVAIVVLVSGRPGTAVRDEKTPVATLAKPWKLIDSLMRLGLTQSAGDSVERIYKAATATGAVDQTIKAIIYRMRLESLKEEDAFVKTLMRLGDEIKAARFPVSVVLHSMLAECYWHYYQNNRRRFYERAPTVDYKAADIRTWDLRTILEKTAAEYELSLQNQAVLKKTPLDIFDESIINKSAGSKFRPTLFDFLAFRAIDFYSTDDNGLTKPATEFSLNSAEYFKPFEKFIHLKLATVDTASLKFRALRLLQQLTFFHAENNELEALIDADLQRLSFVRQNAALADKDSLYLKALISLESLAPYSPASAEIIYKIASLHREWADSYVWKKNDRYRWMNTAALGLCDKAIQSFAGSYGAQQCAALKAQIRGKSLSCTIETVNPPYAAFRALVSYKNTEKIFWRCIAIPMEDYQRISGAGGDSMAARLLTIKPASAWSTTLPSPEDFQNHSAEVEIPGLPPGHYAILCSPDSLFKLPLQSLGFVSTQISKLSFVERRLTSGDQEFIVADRATGAPLKGVLATVSVRVYNGTTPQPVLQFKEAVKSDKDGRIRIRAGTGGFENCVIDFSYGIDRLRAGGDYYLYPAAKNAATERLRTYFFTDRAIYRPGQTIYFKGILLRINGDRVEIAPRENTLVHFYDVNGQEVGRLALTSNEFGSIHGSIIAPAATLSGQMYLTDGRGSVYVSVEEYKRPKFEVRLDAPPDCPMLGEIVTCTGHAKAYAGGAIDGAKVTYRVVREARLPPWSLWWRPPYWNPKTEIAHGETITNDTGLFTAAFKASADPAVAAEENPIFSYTLTADVIDITGETRSAQTSISAGYASLVLAIGFPQLINRETDSVFPLTTENLNGVFQSVEGVVAAYRLAQPIHVYRQRLWPGPDTAVMTLKHCASVFPTDLYADETDSTTWAKTDTMFRLKFNTGINKNLKIPGLRAWKQGAYKIEASVVDKIGHTTRFEKYVTVFSEREKALPLPMPDWFVPVKIRCEPGEKAVFLVGSGYDDVKILYEIERKGEIVKKQWLTFKGSQTRIETPIEEQDRGDIAVHCTFIRDSRAYRHDAVIAVPWTNKELAVSFETLRDKLVPGAPEQWRLHVSGKSKDTIAAEMAATLYDASLDAFKPLVWNFDVYHSYGPQCFWDINRCFDASLTQWYENNWNDFSAFPLKEYPSLQWFGYGFEGSFRYPGYASDESAMIAPAAPMSLMKTAGGGAGRSQISRVAAVHSDLEEKKQPQQLEKPSAPPTPALRANLNETAFFYPCLQTDKNGDITLAFTMPEALTRWKLLLMTHTRDCRYALTSKEIVTQKPLMVAPNLPRFVREGDTVFLAGKVSNLTDSVVAGTGKLQLLNAVTLKPADSLCKKSTDDIPFTVKNGRSAALAWKIIVPEGIEALTIRMSAQSEKYSDGEELTIPVLTNRILVTESMPFFINKPGTKKYTFDKLAAQNGASKTIRNHRLTLEYTANPVWYAVQALPYLMEYPYECAEQIFSRFFANALAAHIVSASPRIKAVFDAWRQHPSGALISNLEKNQDLKNLMAQETPWLLDGKDESESKCRIALLFDVNTMAGQRAAALERLKKIQRANGAWPWFEGMPEDRYITQYIATGLGKLRRIGVLDSNAAGPASEMALRCVHYADDKLREDYEELLRCCKATMAENHLGQLSIQYLYMRSFFKHIPLMDRNRLAFDYYAGQAKKYWVDNHRYLQGMLAVAFSRGGDSATAAAIVRSLKENALHSEEMGMYWKEMYEGSPWLWHQAPIESQALMVEVFDEAAHDGAAVEDLKTWLIKSKQTNHWPTTRATAEACYALLMRGRPDLQQTSKINLSLGGEAVDAKPENGVEAATGYFKHSWTGSDIRPAMGNVVVTKEEPGAAWGALYWRYFENIDKITPHATPLSLTKKLFKQQNGATGPVLVPVTSLSVLKPGDKIIARIELRVDRDMEYVHLKDMRASGFEPINVFSEYRWQDGLGYYESTRDAATDFFFSAIRKGTYVFQYPLVAAHAGEFSNGIATIQCMYAPEFTSHSEGIRVRIERP